MKIWIYLDLVLFCFIDDDDEDSFGPSHEAVVRKRREEEG